MASPYRNADEANALRWTPELENYYEIYYLTLNGLESRTGYWIRHTIHAPQGDPAGTYAEVWFTFYNLERPDDNFGITRQFPMDAVASTSDPFSLKIGDVLLENGVCRGSLEGRGHSAQWDLHFEPCDRPFLHFPEHLYTSGEVESAMLSPHFSTRFTGTIVADGHRFELKNDPGEQSRTWGRQHPPHWLWTHCNHFEEDSEAIMELVAAPSDDDANPPVHVMYVKCHGREFRLISLLDGSRSYHDATPGKWHVRAEGDTLLLEAEISCRLCDIAEAHYRDPNGVSAFCTNTIVASSVLKVSTREDESGPWQTMEPLHSNGTTHAEWGDCTPHPQIENKILVIS